jgi:hypothetical protein
MQGIGMAPTETHGRPWLALVAELCPEASLSLRSALLYQDRLAFGAIVLRKDVYLLRHGVPLEPLTPRELDWTLRILAHEAIKLRANLRAAAATGDAFDIYAE